MSKDFRLYTEDNINRYINREVLFDFEKTDINLDSLLLTHVPVSLIDSYLDCLEYGQYYKISSTETHNSNFSIFIYLEDVFNLRLSKYEFCKMFRLKTKQEMRKIKIKSLGID